MKKDSKSLKLNLTPERVLWYIEMYKRGLRIEEIDWERQHIT